MGTATMPSLAQTPAEVADKKMALEMVAWDWQPILSGWEIRFHRSRSELLGLGDSENQTTDVWARTSQSELFGLCDLDNQVIDVWVKTLQTRKSIAKILVHELAHAFDYKFLNPEMRREWLLSRGAPNAEWYTPSGRKDDYSLGAGDFAESLSWMLQGHGRFRSRLGPRPNAKQQALLGKWLALAAATQSAAK